MTTTAEHVNTPQKFDGKYWQQIPNEFRPRAYQTTSLESKLLAEANNDIKNHNDLNTDDDGENLFDLFQSNDDSDEEDENDFIEHTTIGKQTYHLRPPPDTGTLFAHKVWSGSKLLATYLYENSDLIRNKCTVELGAGTALPSLVCLNQGSSISIITDYPDDGVIHALKETVGWNWECIHEKNLQNDYKVKNNNMNLMNRVGVIGHEWGKNTKSVQDFALNTFTNNVRMEGNQIKSMDRDQNKFYFDVAILSECLWMHRTHQDLAKSLHELLHPLHGMAIVTYAHHIPGCEEEDDAFFQICAEKYGMITEHVMTKPMDYMWDKTKSIDIHLKIVRNI